MGPVSWALALTAALQGECVIRFSDITDREWVGTLMAESSIEPTRVDWITKFSPFALRFLCADPTARSQELVSLAAPAATFPLFVDLTLGTAPSRINVTLDNGGGAPITAIEVRVLNAADENLTGIGWTGSVPSGGTWVLQTDPVFEISVNGVNAGSGRQPSLINEVYPIADPAAGAAKLWISIVGGSSVSATVEYRRRWW